MRLFYFIFICLNYKTLVVCVKSFNLMTRFFIKKRVFKLVKTNFISNNCGGNKFLTSYWNAFSAIRLNAASFVHLSKKKLR